MIVKVFNNENKQQSCHSFKEKEVTIGRNPSSEASVILDSQTVSRNHVKIYLKKQKLKVQDLNSSNGTYINDEEIESNIKVSIKEGDKIKVAQFEGFIKVFIRENEQNQKMNNKHSSAKKKAQYSDEKSDNSSGDDVSEQRQRSRDKKKKHHSTSTSTSNIHLAESTLKMLRSMTAEKKSKSEKVKFLKLMGVAKAEQHWDQIQEMIKSKKTYFLANANKKYSTDLQKQFSQSRAGHQKKGLGR